MIQEMRDSGLFGGAPLPNYVEELWILRVELRDLVGFYGDIYSWMRELEELPGSIQNVQSPEEAYQKIGRWQQQRHNRLRPLATAFERRRPDLIDPYVDKEGYSAFDKFFLLMTAPKECKPADWTAQAIECMRVYYTSLQHLERKILAKLEDANRPPSAKASAKKNKGGRKKIYDPQKDKKIHYERKLGEPYCDIAARFDMTIKEAKAARERQRKRLKERETA